MHFLNSVTLSHNWDVYFTRFLVVVWFLVFPCVFIGLFFFFKEINKRRDVVFVFPLTKNFKPYSYVWHNFLFLFFSGTLAGNTFVLFYILSAKLSSAGILSLFDVAIFFSASFTLKMLISIIVLGCIFHLFCFCVYIHYNLYKTNSYFGESWRAFIINSSSRFEFIKKKALISKFYAKIWKLFFDVKEVTLDIEDRKIIILE